jgi:hypothetical protein
MSGYGLTCSNERNLMKQFGWQKVLIGLAIAASCMLVGAAIPTTNRALGEVRGGAPDAPSFQAGSVPVLREISATLHQMDGRLARLETLAQKMSAKTAIGAQRAATAEPTGDNN